MKQFDWGQPQRQPVAGLLVVFINTLWEVFKSTWPFLLIALFGRKSSMNRYEIYAFVFLGFTIISAVLKFIYFKFSIEDGKLIIKKGWLKKETRVIPLERIQTVNIEQGPVHQLLNIVKLSIDTAGSEKTEATIDALKKDMAEALRIHLLSEKQTEDRQVTTEVGVPLIQLRDKDLIKLSISANHVEALLILLSFGFGLYDNLKDIDNNIFAGLFDIVPANTIYQIMAIVVAVLIVTVLFSTLRIFFKFYSFRVFRKAVSFYIRTGLMSVKERVVPFQKIQYVSWKANWIRKLMRLWILEFHIAGGSDLKTKQKVQVPVTQDHFVPLLVDAYHTLPVITDEKEVRIHRSYIMRRILIGGIVPSLFILPLLWLIWQERALFFIAYPVFIGVYSWLEQKKFRLWALSETGFVKRGTFGERRILFQWYKIQSVELRQSLFQRKKELATLVMQTAGGSLTIPFIDLKAAREIANYSLYKVETSVKPFI